VVVTSSGSADHLGKTAIVDEVVAEQDASFSNFVQRLRPSADADGRYLRYFLSSNVASFEFGRLGTTSTGLRNLSGGLLGSVACPGPPVDEQRRIADFLDTEAAGIDALITAKQQMADGLIASRMDTMRAGVAGEVVSGDRSKASLAWLPELPTHWGMAKLTLLARLGSGHTPSRSRPEWWMNPTIPWITTGEVAQMRSDRIELILAGRLFSVERHRRATRPSWAVPWRSARTSPPGPVVPISILASCCCACEPCVATSSSG